MQIKFIYLLAGLLLLQQAVATAPVYGDTTVQQDVRRWTQKQFLDLYGTSDTARALIHYYFGWRKKARRQTLMAGSIGTAAGLGFVAAEAAVSKQRDIVGGDVLLLFFLIVGAATAFCIAFVKFTRWLRFSRKNLHKQLERHKAGGPLPSWLLKLNFLQEHAP